MGQLPAARTTPDCSFTTTGVNYAGPFILKKGHTRRPMLVKAYLAIFVCFFTKAVHLEVVSDLTTEAFLAALRGSLQEEASLDTSILTMAQTLLEPNEIYRSCTLSWPLLKCKPASTPSCCQTRSSGTPSLREDLILEGSGRQQ